jgi:hypothetical protein
MHSIPVEMQVDIRALLQMPLLESNVLRGDPQIYLVSTAAARELRDCHFAPIVRELVGLGGEAVPSSGRSRIGL